ncbi:MAG: hypothetical protein KDK70_21955, partial [Myxococcales bacterium]|nr:hypothetical protein [Myxococcales bacterium]
DLRMQCLRRQRLRLEATVDVLAHAGPEEAQTAVQQVTSLPPLERCADAEALGAAVPPPEHPGAAEAVQGLRDALTRVAALTQAGRYDDARAALAPLLERTAAVVQVVVDARSAGQVEIECRDQGPAYEPTAVRFGVTRTSRLDLRVKYLFGEVWFDRVEVRYAD